MEVRARLVKRFRRIANKNNITYTEVLKIFRSQFKFTRDKIAELSSDEIEGLTEEQLGEYTFNFIYLGKIYTNKKLQEYGKEKRSSKTKGD